MLRGSVAPRKSWSKIDSTLKQDIKSERSWISKNSRESFRLSLVMNCLGSKSTLPKFLRDGRYLKENTR